MKFYFNKKKLKIKKLEFIQPIRIELIKREK
jgi:hypothetical protein